MGQLVKTGQSGQLSRRIQK